MISSSLTANSSIRDGINVYRPPQKLDSLFPLAVKQRPPSWPVEALSTFVHSSFSEDSHCTLMRRRWCECVAQHSRSVSVSRLRHTAMTQIGDRDEVKIGGQRYSGVCASHWNKLTFWNLWLLFICIMKEYMHLWQWMNCCTVCSFHIEIIITGLQWNHYSAFMCWNLEAVSMCCINSCKSIRFSWRCTS